MLEDTRKFLRRARRVVREHIDAFASIFELEQDLGHSVEDPLRIAQDTEAIKKDGAIAFDKFRKFLDTEWSMRLFHERDLSGSSWG